MCFGCLAREHGQLCGVDLRHRFLREVSPFRHGPFVVGLDEHRGDEAGDGGVVGEDAHDVGAPLDLAVDALEGIRRPKLSPVRLREGAEGQEVLGCVAEHGGDVGELAGSMAVISSSWARTWTASGWAKIVRMAAATISAEALGTLAKTLRMKCTRHRCQAAPMKTASMALSAPGGDRRSRARRRRAPERAAP